MMNLMSVYAETPSTLRSKVSTFLYPTPSHLDLITSLVNTELVTQLPTSVVGEAAASLEGMMERALLSDEIRRRKKRQLRKEA
jgi:hypothetical protein